MKPAMEEILFGFLSFFQSSFCHDFLLQYCNFDFYLIRHISLKSTRHIVECKTKSMFGQAQQKPAGFSFGAPSTAPTNNTSTPSFNFSSNNNNNTASVNALNKPSGFSFGNPTNTTSNLFSANNSTSTAPKLGGFSLNTPAKPTTSGFSFENTGPSSSSSGFSFANKPITTPSLNTSSFGAKPSLFGNSSTNPSFCNTMNNLTFNQNEQVQQQQQITNPSSYGVDFAKFSAEEMPKSLTSASDDSTKLKRKRSTSVSSTNNNASHNNSLVGRIVDTFKVPSKYSIENIYGLFTSNKHNNNSKNICSDDSSLQLQKYSASIGMDIPRVPASKSEYRRLTIKSSKNSYVKYDEIDPNTVILSRRTDLRSNIKKQDSEPKVGKSIIESFKPPSKRIKKESSDIIEKVNHKEELTFSKPLSEQIDKTQETITEMINQKEDKNLEYWCTPSIEDLSKLSSLELAHVENFTAGRKGFGNLMFKYPVDLSAFEGNWDQLLHKTILFQHRTLQVYPNEVNKPSEGNGLNVPAVITLEKVFPRQYDVLNPDMGLLERHIQRLKSTHGMKFISFDPINGTYVFEVEHFSIWGIVDEEDDDPEIVAKWKKQQELEYTNEKRRNELQINALEKIAGYGQPGDSWKRQKPDFGVVAPGTFELEDKYEKINKDLLLTQTNIDEDEIVDASVPSGIDNGPEEIDENNIKLALIRNANDIDELVEVRAYEPEVKDLNLQVFNAKTELSISNNWDEQLKLSNGFFSAFNKNLDSRYNVKLDPKNVGDLIFGDKDTSKLVKVITEPPFSFENSEKYQKCLKTELFQTRSTLRTNNLPLFFLDDHIKLTTPLLSFEASSDFTSWELLSILYDDNYVASFLSRSLIAYTSNSLPKRSHILDIKRRELLCDFLQKIISMNLEQNSFESSSLPRDNVDKIYHFICTDKLPDAIQYALNTRNNHLAVLLTMIDSNDKTIHKLARAQLKEWENGSLNFIPSSVLKVYKLLMGNILSKEYVNHLDGLTWPVVLYLLIKYGDTNQTLKNTINQFIEYCESTGISENPVYQVFFPLLKLYNSEFVIIGKFDIEFQFLLMKHLKSVIKFSDEQFDNVVEGFSKKLEKKGFVEEAAFVLEHMIDDKKNENLLTQLFADNVCKFGFLEDDHRLGQIQRDLHVPHTLLHLSRSVEFKHRKEYYKSTLELISANKLKQAHDFMLEFVAPGIIISDVSSDIIKLENLIKEFLILSESNIGACVYGDYISVVEFANTFDYNDDEYETKCNKLKEMIDNMFGTIPFLVETNSKVKIAKTVMIKKLISIAFREGLECNVDQLSSLELPESEKNYLEANLDNEEDDFNNRMVIS